MDVNGATEAPLMPDYVRCLFRHSVNGNGPPKRAVDKISRLLPTLQDYCSEPFGRLTGGCACGFGIGCGRPGGMVPGGDGRGGCTTGGRGRGGWVTTGGRGGRGGCTTGGRGGCGRQPGGGRLPGRQLFQLF